MTDVEPHGAGHAHQHALVGDAREPGGAAGQHLGGHPHLRRRLVWPVQVAPRPERPLAPDEHRAVVAVAVPPVAELGAPDDEGVVHDGPAARVGDRLEGAHEPRDLGRVMADVVGHRGVLGGVLVDVVGDALVHLVADVVGPELGRRHLAERQRDHPGDVAAEGGRDDVGERVETEVVALEIGRGLRRGVARERGEALEPVAQPLDEPEVSFEPGSFAGREAGRQLAVLAVREVEGRAAAPAHRVARRRRPEDPVPGPQRRTLGRQPHAPEAVADGAARLEGGVERELERGQPVGPRDVRGDDLIQRRRDRPRVPRREVGVVAGPGVNPPPVVAVAPGVELGGGQRQPVEREQAPPVGVERGQGAAEVALRERREVERPRLAGGPAGMEHPPSLVGPAVAVADDHQAPDRPRLGAEGPQRGVGNRRPERGQPAHPQHASSRDHSWPPVAPAPGRRRKRSLPAIDTSSSSMESSARNPACSASSPGAAASSRSPRA